MAYKYYFTQKSVGMFYDISPYKSPRGLVT